MKSTLKITSQIKLIVIFFCFVSPITLFASSAKQCELNGINYHQAVKLTQKLQTAIKSDDPKKIANMLDYPINFYLPANTAKQKPQKLLIKNKQEFLDKYPTLFTETMKISILAQNSSDIFCNYQGATIAGGIVWFNTDNGYAKIFSVNVLK